MRTYELVALIDPRQKKEDIDALKKELQDLLGDRIKETDDIGMLELAYTIKDNDRAYFVSYYIDAEESFVNEATEELKLKRQILRFFFYRMKPSDKFLKFDEVNKMFEKSEEEKEKEENENAFKDMENLTKANTNS